MGRGTHGDVSPARQSDWAPSYLMDTLRKKEDMQLGSSQTACYGVPRGYVEGGGLVIDLLENNLLRNWMMVKGRS